MPKAIDIVRSARKLPEPARVEEKPTPRRKNANGLSSLIILGGGVILFGSIVSNQASGTSQTTPPSRVPVPTQSVVPTTSTGPTLFPGFVASTDPSPTVSSAPSASPSTTPTPVVSKTATLSIRILNGSGTPGQANALKADLEKIGYPIRLTAVAKTHYEITTIYYPTGGKAAAETLITKIKNRKPKLEENTALAQPDDILIVVGVK